MSSYPISSNFSSSSLLIGSPSVNNIVEDATIPKSPGSVATILNSTDLNPPLTINVSPLIDKYFLLFNWSKGFFKIRD